MADLVQDVRRFNRRWTRLFGLLGRDFLRTSHTLADARVIYELAQRQRWERRELRERLGIDDSYLTRILARLARKNLVAISASEVDGRRRTVTLTKSGRAEYRLLDERSTAEVETILSPLSVGEKRMLGEAVTVIPRLVGRDEERREVSYRGLRPGDMGWVVQRHGELYHDEYGWNADFEALVGRIVVDYRAHHRPGRENAWIAEVDGARAGCIFCCAKDEETALLRILLVEPWARGFGIGSALVARCIDFARGAGYRTLALWTNDVLVSARRIYENAGFELLDEQQHHSFGHALVGQNWALDLYR